MSEMNALRKDPMDLLFLFPKVGIKGKTHERSLSGDTGFLISELQPQDHDHYIAAVYKSPSLWHFVKAAQID